MKIIRFALLAIALLLCNLTLAQDNNSPISSANVTETAEKSCELHVWPSSGLRSVFHGWVHGGIVDGAVKGRDGYPEIPKDPLNADRQVDLTSAVPLPAILKLPDYHVVMHETPLESRVARNSVGRIETATPPCYAELVFDDVFLQQDSFSGNHLKTFFRHRNFDGDFVTRSFGAFTQSNLEVFPPKTPKENEAALKDLDAAFTSNIVQFGEYLNKPSKGKKANK